MSLIKFDTTQLPYSGEIFHDPSGRRMKWISLAVACLVVLVFWMTSFMQQLLDSPFRTSQLNQDPSFPRSAVGDLDSLPMVGDTNRGVLTRIARTVQVDGRILLADPFSDQIWRTATANEQEVIGDSPYAMERFGVPAARQLMLTFDDGPHPEYTPELLDMLSASGVPATFFVLGNNVLRSPEIVQRTIREGHMVAGHTMSHTPDFTAQSDATNRHELSAAERVILGAASYSTRVWRIPEADADVKPLAVMAGQQLGYLQADFDIDTLDWEYAIGGEAVPVPELDGQGHVILLHDGGGDRSATLAMVRKLIDEAKAQGYTFATMESLLPPEYVPAKGTLPNMADRAAYNAAWLSFVMPTLTVEILTVVGIAVFFSYTLVYTVAAAIYSRKSRNRQWWRPKHAAPHMASVIVPAHNEGPTIVKTLASLATTLYVPFEIIVVDDGSTDDTLALAKAFMQKHPELRMTVLHQKNRGKSHAVQAGIEASIGSVIITMDGDTIFQPETVGNLTRHFDDESIGAVGGHIKVGNRATKLGLWQSVDYLTCICLNRAGDSILSTITVTPGACGAYRRSAVRQAGGFTDRTKAEDADMTVSIRRLGYRVVQDNDAVAWTEAPSTLWALFKQRLRWTFGAFQVLYVHRDLLFKSGSFALSATLWYMWLSIGITALFAPMVMTVVLGALLDGRWLGTTVVFALVILVRLLQTIMALIITREERRHMLMALFYLPLAEPLRMIVMYVSLGCAVLGGGIAFGWNKEIRRGSVAAPQVEVAATP